MEKRLRILFVTSEHPDFLYNGLGTFTRDYVCELKKYCDVFCVYFHLSGGIKPLPNEIVDLVFWIATTLLGLLTVHFAIFAVVGLFTKKKFPKSAAGSIPIKTA